MKKSFFLLGAAALMLATSCSDKTASTFTPEEKALGDSVAIVLGKNFGYEKRLQNDRYLTREGLENRFDVDEYLRGVAYVLNLDTANFSYARGISDGLQLYMSRNNISERFEIPVSPKLILNSLKETYKNDSVDEMQLMKEMNQLDLQLRERYEAIEKARREKVIAENTAAGKQYVDSLLKDGYKKAPSGLVYKIENPGEGAHASGNDIVSATYVGRHLNGAIFDSSNGRAVQFSLKGVVPGFAEALELVGKGGKVTAVLPSDIAYGDTGAGSDIEPGETLVFDIEVVEIETPAEVAE